MMSKSAAGIAIVPLLFSLTALANPSLSGTQACSRTSLQSFRISGIQGYPQNEPVDLCGKSELDPKERILFQKLTSIHSKVRKLFHIPANTSEEDFRGALSIEIIGNPFGVLISSNQIHVGNPSKMTLGMFTDSGIDEFPISTYTHEYGHMLAVAPHSSVTPLFKEVIRNELFIESFPDMLAMDVLGLKDHLPSEGVPSRLMQATRKWDMEQTYYLPANTFASSNDFASLVQSCTQVDTKSMSRREASLCQAALLMPEPKIFLPKTQSFFEYVQSRNGQAIEDFDPHQLGTPILSFLVQLGQKTGFSPMQLFMKAIGHEADLEKMKSRVRCLGQLPGGVLLKSDDTILLTNAFFKNLEAVVSPSLKDGVFDSLMKHFGLEAGFKTVDGEKIRIFKGQGMMSSLLEAVRWGEIENKTALEIYDNRDLYYQDISCEIET